MPYSPRDAPVEVGSPMCSSRSAPRLNANASIQLATVAPNRTIARIWLPVLILSKSTQIALRQGQAMPRRFHLSFREPSLVGHVTDFRFEGQACATDRSTVDSLES